MSMGAACVRIPLFFKWDRRIAEGPPHSISRRGRARNAVRGSITAFWTLK